ncbi:MAG: family 1 glycosylhydrolase [Proteobacteria bacterium]|nr:family 1 glycosylhydrolase [Pseudomonadota bacterium]
MPYHYLSRVMIIPSDLMCLFITLFWCSFVSWTPLLAKNTNSSKDDPREIWSRLPLFDDLHDHSNVLADFPDDFQFGLANAPSHVEDSLEDSWLEFAKRGGVKAFDNIYQPEKRLNFFSDPLIEIKLAKETGVKIFRLGISWARLVPDLPAQFCVLLFCPRQIQDLKALERYRQILTLIKKHDMQVMVTLFHHDMPKWAIPTYADHTLSKLGWLNPSLKSYFHDFALEVVDELGDQIDYIVIFNEPVVFSLLTHLIDYWPPGDIKDPKNSVFNFDVMFRGLRDFSEVMENIIATHIQVYKSIKEKHPRIKIGASHLSPLITNRSGPLLKFLVQHLHKNLIVYGFPDATIQYLDFLGLNYYGEEELRLFDYSLPKNRSSLYSDSGRKLNADGLYQILMDFHTRYKKRNPSLEYIITENGIADDTDLVRMPYLIEHLLAVHHAIRDGVNIKGYIFWTISDNWEWADGYCPKFGLVHVDRANNFARYPKPSFHLFKSLVNRGHITESMREYAHNAVDVALHLRDNDQKFAQRWDGKRSFCRKENGIHGHDQPLRIPLQTNNNWYFQNTK